MSEEDLRRRAWGIGIYRYTDEETGEVIDGYGIGVKPRNPHDFSPDFECCSEDEIKSWKGACETWDAKGKK